MDEESPATLTEDEMRELEEFMRALVIGFVENQFKDMQIVRNDGAPGDAAVANQDVAK
jgi:hypothetical protein